MVMNVREGEENGVGNIRKNASIASKPDHSFDCGINPIGSIIPHSFSATPDPLRLIGGNKRCPDRFSITPPFVFVVS